MFPVLMDAPPTVMIVPLQTLPVNALPLALPSSLMLPGVPVESQTLPDTTACCTFESTMSVFEPASKLLFAMMCRVPAEIETPNVFSEKKQLTACTCSQPPSATSPPKPFALAMSQPVNRQWCAFAMPMTLPSGHEVHEHPSTIPQSQPVIDIASPWPLLEHPITRCPSLRGELGPLNLNATSPPFCTSMLEKLLSPEVSTSTPMKHEPR